MYNTVSYSSSFTHYGLDDRQLMCMVSVTGTEAAKIKRFVNFRSLHLKYEN